MRATLHRMMSSSGRARAAGLLVGLGLVAASGPARAQSALDRAFADLFRGPSVADRQKAAAAIARTGSDFNLVYARLKSGPRYGKDVKTGLVEESRKGERFREQYVFLVPKDYDPSRSYRVSFYLHGGVGRSEPWEKGDSWWRRFDRMEGTEQISVFPSAWRGSLWWQPGQIENLKAILDRLKADYNVDENRVYLFGVSDGGTGAYYQAFKAPTIWAAFFPFIGYSAVLDNPATGADGEMFVSNLVNKPFFIVNGEADPLYPAARVRPLIESFQKAGVELVFRSVPGGHNTRFWSSEQEAIEEFIRSHPRQPFPDRLQWETDRSDRATRIDWLVIEALETYGVPGRVALRRSGNHVEVETQGVGSYRLLLSPDQFDFSAPVEVVTNGVQSFRGGVERSTETLLRWAAQDFDRSMLFAAEVRVEIPRPQER
jgi:predicted esterase